MSLRVVAGGWGGRRLQAPKGRGTRPTSERVREALFSILGDRVLQARVLDLCCGSGALGFEALSRGAAFCTFVDDDRRAIDAVRANAEALSVKADRHRVVAEPAARFLRAPPTFDLVLCDPPYADVAAVAGAVFAAPDLVAPGGLVVIEHRAGEAPDVPNEFEDVQLRKYGDTALLIVSPSRE